MVVRNDNGLKACSSNLFDDSLVRVLDHRGCIREKDSEITAILRVLLYNNHYVALGKVIV